MAHTYKYPKADVTVDCVLFGFHPEGRIEVVLIRRGVEPFKGKWALPGGFINLPDETAENAAERKLREETGITVGFLEQLYTFDAPDRDPRGRVLSVAYYGLVRTQDHIAKCGTDATEALWMSVADAMALPPSDWAFDHHEILQTAVTRLQGKVMYAPIVGFNLLPRRFTLAQLQRLYEAVLFRPLDRGNFRKRIRILNQATGILVKAGERRNSKRPGPPATLYRFNKKAYEKAVRDGFNFEMQTTNKRKEQ